MAASRKEIEKFILTWVEKIAPGGHNAQLYTKKFAAMDDKDFWQFIDDLKAKKTRLALEVPNWGPVKLDIRRNLKLGLELGYDFHQQLWIGPKENEGYYQPAYLTPIKFMVADTFVRRQSQSILKKRSIPKHQKTVDQLSGQPTGPSKGAKMSQPELQVLAGMGLENSLLELIKHRGGDKGGYNALTAMMLRYGNANLRTLNQYATGVISTKTLRAFMTAAHLKVNV